MSKDKLPPWAPYAGFCLVVVLVAGFVVATSRGDEVSPEGTPVTQDELPSRAEPAGLAVRAAVFVSAGGFPAASALYHPRILTSFGRVTVEDSLRLRRPALTGQTFAVRLEERTGNSALVIIRSTGPAGKAEYSFTLARAGDSWQIVYDSLLGDALVEFVTLREQRESNSPGARPSASATEAGQTAGKRYRQLLLDR